MRKQRNQTQGADELLDSNLVYILAQYGRPILFQKIQEWGENTAYKLKARYHGEIPVICRQGRWYSPFFWMQHFVLAAMSFFVAPFLLPWASILRPKWELDHIATADIVIFFFDPQTSSPITLLERGICSATKPRSLIVCAPKGFWRRGNIEIVCARSQIKLVETIEELKEQLAEKINLVLKSKAL